MISGEDYGDIEDDGSATNEEIEVMRRRREKIQRYYEAKRTERQRIKRGNRIFLNNEYFNPIPYGGIWPLTGFLPGLFSTLI